MELIELMKRLTGELCGTANQIQIQFNSILWEWMELIELDWFVFGAAQAYAELKNCEWISFVFLFCGGLWAQQRHNAPQKRENKDKGNEMSNSIQRSMKRGAAVFVWFLGQWALLLVGYRPQACGRQPAKREDERPRKQSNGAERIDCEWIDETKCERLVFLFCNEMEEKKTNAAMKWRKGTPPQAGQSSAVSSSINHPFIAAWFWASNELDWLLGCLLSSFFSINGMEWDWLVCGLLHKRFSIF